MYTIQDIINARRQGYLDRCREEYGQAVQESLAQVSSTMPSDAQTAAVSSQPSIATVQVWQAQAATKYPLMVEQPRIVTDPDDPTTTWRVIAGVLQVKHAADIDYAPASMVPFSVARMQLVAGLLAQPTEIVPASA